MPSLMGMNVRQTGSLRTVPALLVGLLPSLTRAAEAGGSSLGAGAVVGPREIVNTGLSLLLIVAAIMALAWIYTRLQGGRARNGDVIRIVAAQPLGAKERVMLVDVAGQHLLIGVTASQIRTLHVLDEPVTATAPATESSGFAERLRGIVQGAVR